MKKEYNKSIKSLNIPYDLSEFFAYITPATIFFIGLIILGKADNCSFNIIDILEKNGFLGVQTSPIWLEYIIGPFTFILLLYIVGHVIATISAFLIDRIVVEKCNGYPYVRLFNLDDRKIENIEKKDDKYHLFKSSYYLIIVNLLIVMFIIANFCTGLQNVLVIITFIIVLIILYQVIISSSYYLIKDATEKNIELRKKGRKVQKKKWFVRWSQIILINIYPRKKSLLKLRNLCTLPFIPLLKYILKMLGSLKPLEKPIREKAIKKFKEIFDSDIKDLQTAGFWLTYIFINENSRYMSKHLIKYYRLYHFTRNVAMSFLLLSFISLFIRYYHNELNTSQVFTTITFILGLVFLIRYYYYYYNYFSRYLFRCLTIIDPIKKRTFNNQRHHRIK